MDIHNTFGMKMLFKQSSRLLCGSKNKDWNYGTRKQEPVVASGATGQD